MADDYAIKVEGLHKSFKLPNEKQSSIKSALINWRKRGYEKQHVLKNASFEVQKGEFFGIVGRNGSGKSTLLKLLAGIYSPDRGVLEVKGSLTPFIELGVGFNPELTGRENVFLNGALLGFGRKEMVKMYKDIVKFSELERFMDQKLKNYSSGMQVRLAFSIAVRAKSDVLLLDEVLAVGDASFQKKCFDYFRELKRSGQTVVFISHDMNAVREYCDRAMLIEKGEVVAIDSSEKIALEYTKLFMDTSKIVESKTDKRFGTQRAAIDKVKVAGGTGDTITATIDITVNETIEKPIIGLHVTSPIGQKIAETNTLWKHVKTATYHKGDKLRVTWKSDNIFTNGQQRMSIGIASNDGDEYYDRWEDAAVFTVDRDEVTTALALPEQEMKVEVRK